jgi:hypothetical protein
MPQRSTTFTCALAAVPGLRRPSATDNVAGVTLPGHCDQVASFIAAEKAWQMPADRTSYSARAGLRRD